MKARIVAISLLICVGTVVLAAEPNVVVPIVRDQLQPEVDRDLAAAQKKTLAQLDLANDVAALYKHPIRQKAVRDPWRGLTELESNGLALAKLAESGLGTLPDVVDALGKLGDRPIRPYRAPAKLADNADLAQHLDHIAAVLGKATAAYNAASGELRDHQSKMLFDSPARLIHEFGPQLGFDQQAREILRQDRDFCVAAMEWLGWAKLLEAARDLLQLTDSNFTASLSKAASASTARVQVPGVTGDVIAVRETPIGLIIIGGPGKNIYDVKTPVAFVFDVGGDDEYRGTFAVNADAKHPLSLWIDAAGNDKYSGAELTCGVGRCGIGMLLDLAGNDTYVLAPGSGGCGFAGIGLLCDVAGDDSYSGTVYTQGSAIAGIGLLFDLDGTDKYTSHGFALGLGGPGGIGAVIDCKGNDTYQCGHKIPSGYNASDAPTAKPGDPNFQYDAFGMAIGLGRRVWPPSPESAPFQLAGGIGIIIDLAGNDSYDSSNFSQACGYFFGAGLKLDLAGDDHHRGARYGHASGAHFGLGLMIDYAGKDRYTSAGPTYNGGCSWDRSVFLMIDAGDSNDTYEWMNTSGPARADIGSWGAFADLGGDDTYRITGPPSQTSRDGLGLFLDAAGKDAYPAFPDVTPALGDGVRRVDPAGGLFLDRKSK